MHWARVQCQQPCPQCVMMTWILGLSNTSLPTDQFPVKTSRSSSSYNSSFEVWDNIWDLGLDWSYPCLDSGIITCPELDHYRPSLWYHGPDISNHQHPLSHVYYWAFYVLLFIYLFSKSLMTYFTSSGPLRPDWTGEDLDQGQGLGLLGVGVLVRSDHLRVPRPDGQD